MKIDHSDFLTNYALALCLFDFQCLHSGFPEAIRPMRQKLIESFDSRNQKGLKFCFSDAKEMIRHMRGDDKKVFDAYFLEYQNVCEKYDPNSFVLKSAGTADEYFLLIFRSCELFKTGEDDLFHAVNLLIIETDVRKLDG